MSTVDTGIELSSDEESRAERLHAESLVIDPLSIWGPVIQTPELLAELDALVEAGADANQLLTATRALNAEAILDGKLEEYWRVWERAGVNVVSPCIGWFGSSFGYTYENALLELARWTKLFDGVDRFVKVSKAADIRRAHAKGKQGVILNFQETTHFGNDLAKLDFFLDLGIRQVELAYDARNYVGDGCTERNPAGLSKFGQRVVRHLNDRHILVDLSHVAAPTCFDAIEVSQAPVAMTHAYAKAVHNTDRAQDDDVIRAVGETGGFVGISLAPFWLTDKPRADLNDFLAHFEHVLELVGPKHVGVGSDWGPANFPVQVAEAMNVETKNFGWRDEHGFDWTRGTAGFTVWEDWPHITRAFVSRGYSDDEIRGFLGENFFSLFETVVG
jgi:membrane dipeptidase